MRSTQGRMLPIRQIEDIFFLSFFTIMAQTPTEGVDTGFLEKAIEGISDPYVLAGIVIACVLIWHLPAIISASAEAMRLGRSNRVEIEGRRKVLESQIKSLEDKRLHRKRRERP